MTKTAILKILLVAVIGAPVVFLAGSTRGPAHVPVGYYDAQRVVGGSRESKAALDAAEAKVKDQLTAAQKLVAEYQKAEAAKAPEATLDAKRAAATAASEAYAAADRAARGAASAEIDRRIAAAVDKLAAARGMSMVLQLPGKLPYAAPECDLTPDIVVAVDAAGPVK